MPKLILDGDSKGAVRAAQDLTEEQRRHGQEVKKVEAIYDAWGQRMREQWKQHQRDLSAAKRESEELGRAAARIVQENEGPQERYNRKVGELSRLFVAGKLNVEQMDRALARYRGELTQVAPAQDSAFGERAVERMTGYFMGLVGPGAMVSAATAALQQYRQELDMLGQQLQGDRAGLGELTQLAVTDKNPEAKMQALVAEAKRVFEMGATNTLGEAGHLVFSLESANITDPKHRALIAQSLASGTIRDPRAFAASIAAVRSAFPQLTPGQTLGMGIVAGTISPGDASQVVAATGKSAQQLKALGWSPAFGLAAESILSRDYGGAEEGGSRLEQMMKHLEHEGFGTDPSLKGLDPFTMLRRIGAGGLGQEHLRKYAGGRMEAMQGLRSLIGNIDLLEQLTQAAAGGDEALVRKTLDLAASTPEIDAARQGVASRNIKSTSRLSSANLQQLYQAMLEEQQQGQGAIASYLTRLHGTIFGQTEAAKELQLREVVGDPFYSGDLQRSVVRYLESLDRKTRDAPLRPGVQER